MSEKSALLVQWQLRHFTFGHWCLPHIRSWNIVDHFYPVRCWAVWWIQYEADRAMNGCWAVRWETWPLCELQERVPGDKQRWSSSWRPICQWICHGRSSIPHKGKRRSEAAWAEEYIHISPERQITPGFTPFSSSVGFWSNLIIRLCRCQAV